MHIIDHPQKLQKTCLDFRCSGLITALVPTMGYYHEGHLSLMRWARENADRVIVSLFVNPTQFGPGEDYLSYPRDFDRDRELAESIGVDILFVPKNEQIYARNHSTFIEVPDLSHLLCGKTRPRHFQGVCTVVCKLFNLTLPNKAVFGQKDWQQLVIIKKMVRDLNLPVEIVGLPIAREKDGLAMSSRNLYLDNQQRREAAQIYSGLQQVQVWVKEGITDKATLLKRLTDSYNQNIPSGEIDYLQLVDPEKLTPVWEIKGKALLAVAIKIGQARLIDNMLVEG